MYWGAGRECRYSGARRDISGIRELLGAPRDVGPSGSYRGVGVSGCIGVSGVYWGTGRECRYSGARRGIGGIRGHWELLRVWGHHGAVRGHQEV